MVTRSDRCKRAVGRPKHCEHKKQRLEKEHSKVKVMSLNTRRSKIELTNPRGSSIKDDAVVVAKTGSKQSKEATGKLVLLSAEGRQGQPKMAGGHSSKYRGVSWHKINSKWEVKIKYNGKQHYLGCFEDEQEAARAYDRAARAQHGVYRMQLNLPTKKEQAAEEAKQQQWIKSGEERSKYRGVSWHKGGNKWQASIRYDGKQHPLGYFEDEEESARAYDKAARAHHGEKAQLNFPAEGERGSRKSSKYRGEVVEVPRSQLVQAR
jgi:hypothetical protein